MMTVAATVTRIRSDHSDGGGQRSRRRGMRGALPSPTAYDWMRRRVPEGRGACRNGKTERSAGPVITEGQRGET
ncbi:hypothetical protein GCM10022214_52510 [Actinomadura miaoliensis]|uniref:Uncharacterized protein n=1 Tax=Actinomadura miaoliensis TaxID=430685 RepID=A0ABP7WD39_9ACTN